MTAAPLPPPFPSWGQRGMLLRRANVHMFAGLAGTFKTMFTLNAVSNMAVDTIYFSNDSDDTTVSSRLLAMVTGHKTEETETWLDPSSGRVEYASQMLAKYSHVGWIFNNSPSFRDMWEELDAYVELHGVYPELIVVDILMNVAHDAGDEWATIRDCMREFQAMARETEAAVLVVHHASEGASTKPCPARREIMGKGGVREALMVTFGVDDDGRYFAACVKNRFGKADLHAKDYFEMGIDPATSRVHDQPIPRPRVMAMAGTGSEEDQWWK